MSRTEPNLEWTHRPQLEGVLSALSLGDVGSHVASGPPAARGPRRQEASEAGQGELMIAVDQAP